MPEPFDLDRFVQAQDPFMERVCRELRDGRKRSHWMWFVFPQLGGLGHSAMARHYAIASLDEVDIYLRHPILGPRLIDCSELVNRVAGRSINEIFGSPDDLKFHSCMTLFSLVQDTSPAFKVALAKYFDGALDPLRNNWRKGGAPMTPETLVLEPNGWVPTNSRLAVFLYRNVLPLIIIIAITQPHTKCSASRGTPGRTGGTTRSARGRTSSRTLRNIALRNSGLG